MNIESDKCPFCGEEDFDGPAMVGHILDDCEIAIKCRDEYLKRADPLVTKIETTSFVDEDRTIKVIPAISTVSIGLLGVELPADTNIQTLQEARIEEIERRILSIEEWIKP